MVALVRRFWSWLVNAPSTDTRTVDDLYNEWAALWDACKPYQRAGKPVPKLLAAQERAAWTAYSNANADRRHPR